MKNGGPNEYIPVSEHIVHSLINPIKDYNAESLIWRLGRIRKRIKKLCIYTLDFFKNFTPQISLANFTNSHWNIEQQLYHENLISKIIDFLNSVDQWLMKEDLMSAKYGYDEDIVSKEKFNYTRDTVRIVILSEIIQYCELNNSLYKQCVEHCKEIVISEIPESLTHTNNSLLKVEREATDKLESLKSNRNEK